MHAWSVGGGKAGACERCGAWPRRDAGDGSRVQGLEVGERTVCARERGEGEERRLGRASACAWAPCGGGEASP
eukprot:3311086-Prymnesium_polylepis.1